MIKVNEIKNNETNNKNSSITESLAMYNHNTIQCRVVIRIYMMCRLNSSATNLESSRQMQQTDSFNW